MRDLAVMVADGGECVSDLGGLRDQQALFGAVASDSTAFRVIEKIAAEPALLGCAAPRARRRARALLGAARRSRAPDDRRGRDADHRALGEGGCGGELQGRLWLSPAAAPRRMRRARRSAASCGPATPARTPPPTTSRCSTWRSSRSPQAHIEDDRDPGALGLRRRHARACRLLPRGADALLGRL